MTNREFVDQYNLSGALPVDPSSRVIPASSYAEALAEFLGEHFRGLIRVEKRLDTAESVLISPEYAAFFFKTLLTYIYGRVFLTLRISSEIDRLVTLIESEEDLPLSDKEMRFLIKTARNAGMDIMPAEKSIKLTLRYSDAAIRRVYAVSPADGRVRMLSKLSEIFFCGAKYTRAVEPAKQNAKSDKK